MFCLSDVEERAPTNDQLISILEYLGPKRAGSVIKGATGVDDALKKFKQDATLFRRPVTVDWNNGRVGSYCRILIDQFPML